MRSLMNKILSLCELFLFGSWLAAMCFWFALIFFICLSDCGEVQITTPEAGIGASDNDASVCNSHTSCPFPHKLKKDN